MIEHVQEQVEKLFAEESKLVSRAGVVFNVRDVAYFYIEDGTVQAWIDKDTVHALDYGLGELEERLRGLFLRTHRQWLVNAKRITGISPRYPTGKDLEELRELLAAEPARAPELTKAQKVEECELNLAGCGTTVPVTSHYARPVMDFLGIGTFEHLAPEHPLDRRYRELGIIDFAWRELEVLDPEDAAAVEAFKAEWDIARFDHDTITTYFRQVCAEELDKRKLIKNLIWQAYRWTKKGIREPSGKNIRSLWYEIKIVLGQYSNVLDPEDVDIFYDTMIELIEREGLFKYWDFRFQDILSPWRGVGTTRPEVVVGAEKLSKFDLLEALGREIGVSYACCKGEPAHIMLEYFSKELHQAVGGKELTVLSITDINPAGSSIERNLVEGLEWHGHKIKRVVRIVDLSEEIWPKPQMVVSVRVPVALYKKDKNDNIEPIKPPTMSHITRARDWYYGEINDDRLLTKSELPGGWTLYKIWGVESDSAKDKYIKPRIYRELGLEPPEDED